MTEEFYALGVEEISYLSEQTGSGKGSLLFVSEIGGPIRGAQPITDVLSKLLEIIGVRQTQPSSSHDSPEAHEPESIHDAREKLLKRGWEPPCVQNRADHGDQDQVAEGHFESEVLDSVKSLFCSRG